MSIFNEEPREHASNIDRHSYLTATNVVCTYDACTITGV
jgi:hypothetical protein